MGILRYMVFVFNLFRCLPHLLIFHTHKDKAIFRKDVARWLQIMDNLAIKRIYKNQSLGLIYLLAFYPEFRSLFYARLGDLKYFMNIFCRSLRTLNLRSPNIGPGLFIQHGFASTISAESIGENCFINQQVTITGEVTMGDNVEVKAGAIIIGKTHIGNNVKIGANATVYKSIPDNSTVFPPTPKVMTWKPS